MPRPSSFRLMRTLAAAPAAAASSSPIATPTSLAADRLPCSATTRACASASAQARSVSSGTSVAPRSAAWMARRARRLFLVGGLRQPIRRHHRVERLRCRRRPAGRARVQRLERDARAAPSAAFSSSVLVFDLASPATITSSDVPIAPAIAAAVPPPGVGSGLASASSNCEQRSVSGESRSRLQF